VVELLEALKGEPALFDANSAVGDWPFRRVPCNTVERLLERMDALNIRRAAVSRLENVFYKDCLAGNRELAALLAPHPERFVPLFTINPAFPGWEQDLDICVEELGLQRGRGGLRLYPTYHHYAIDGPEAGALLARAEAMQAPVAVSVRLEDERTHHWLCKVPAIAPDPLAAAVIAFPNVRWVLCGLRAPQIRAVWRTLSSGARAPAHVLFDLSLVQGPIDECALLVNAVGADRLAFGTNLPLTVAEAPAMALAAADVPAATKAQIGSGNAQRLFNLPG
jgi:predicted TIM-barrel fold metal-dependent hydrolase